MSPTEDKTTADDDVEVDLKQVVDMTTFSQILEMDDEDDREFSSSIVYGFFEQAENTFDEMDEALEQSDLSKLSALGHFLKGSSATLGLFKVRESCEKIQNYGAKRNEDGSAPESDEQLLLSRIKDEIKAVKVEVTEARKALDSFYRKGADE